MRAPSKSIQEFEFRKPDDAGMWVWYWRETRFKMYTPYTEYIDALGSSQRGGETGRERRLQRAPGLAGVLPENIRTVSVWVGGRGAARRLLIAHVLALLLRLQDAHPPLVPGQG